LAIATKTFERAVDFGTTDYMDAGTVLDLNSSFTIRLGKKNGTTNYIF
jgi:hypothetical protein